MTDKSITSQQLEAPLSVATSFYLINHSIVIHKYNNQLCIRQLFMKMHYPAVTLISEDSFSILSPTKMMKVLKTQDWNLTAQLLTSRLPFFCS